MAVGSTPCALSVDTAISIVALFRPESHAVFYVSRGAKVLSRIEHSLAAMAAGRSVHNQSQFLVDLQWSGVVGNRAKPKHTHPCREGGREGGQQGPSSQRISRQLLPRPHLFRKRQPGFRPGLLATTVMKLGGGAAPSSVGCGTVTCAVSRSMEARRARSATEPVRCSVTWHSRKKGARPLSHVHPRSSRSRSHPYSLYM